MLLKNVHSFAALRRIRAQYLPPDKTSTMIWHREQGKAECVVSAFKHSIVSAFKNGVVSVILSI